jgi:hypothetical protein
MNTREENVAAAFREDRERIEQLEFRHDHLQWARKWRAGDAHCPRCGGDDMEIIDRNSEGSMLYETFSCTTEACGARWKVEFQEKALSVVRNGSDDDDNWIELQSFDPPNADRLGLSGREAATINRSTSSVRTPDDVDVRKEETTCDAVTGRIEFAIFAEGEYLESIVVDRARAAAIYRDLGKTLRASALASKRKRGMPPTE